MRDQGAPSFASRLLEGLVLADGSTGSVLEGLSGLHGEALILLPLQGPKVIRGLHDAYFRAGSDLVETATFQASAMGLAAAAARGVDIDGTVVHDASEIAYRVNLSAAREARGAAMAAEAREPGRRRWVAGSMGPGGSLPSLGTATWAGLKASYLPQARGLADGGCDLAIVETCQDPLQAKAAIAALADGKGGRGLPFIVSATVDERRRLLSGTSIAAFVAIMVPMGPLAIGLNCSGGPAELAAALAELAAASPLPLCFMPNAGLPREEDGKAVWPLGPEAFSSLVEGLVRSYGVAVAGGCCGTGVDHMAALNARLGDRPRPASRAALRPALASLYEERPLLPGPLRIVDIALTSEAFVACLRGGRIDEVAALALDQEESGAGALALDVSMPGRDEAADLSALAVGLSPLARSALCLVSGDPPALEAALPFVGGRPLIDPRSLADAGTARRVFALAKEFGAAVLCRTERGEGTGAARALYELARSEVGLDPSSLLFDPRGLAAGGPGVSAGKALAAIGLVREACPGSGAFIDLREDLGALPLDEGLVAAAVFLELAGEAGLEAVILGPGILPDSAAITPAARRAAFALIG